MLACRVPDSVAVVLAAGESRRFWPLSARAHKSLFALNGVPIIERTMRSLSGAGVDRFVVVQSPASATLVRPSDVLPETIDGAPISYVEQPEPARGVIRQPADDDRLALDLPFGSRGGDIGRRRAELEDLCGSVNRQQHRHC